MRDGLEGLTIGITAERSAAQQVELFEARGATTVLGPTLRISSLREDDALRQATLDVIRRPPDFLVASTGFGMRTWLTAADAWGVREALLDALRGARVANRGAKAASANTAAGLAEWWRAPDERFDQVLERVLAEPLAGRRVVLQLHGVTDADGVARLEAAGADVVAVDAYRSSLPTDPAPAWALIDRACADELAAVTFTTAPAVHNLFVLADQRGRAEPLRAAFNSSTVAACVGPVCAAGASEEGIDAPLVPARARLVPMVQALAERLRGARAP